MIGRLPTLSWIGAAVGVIVSTLGAAAWFEFSPSPHGYLELFVALPLLAAGVLVTGIAVLSGWRTLGWASRGLGVLLAVGGLAPLALLVYLFLR